MRKKILRFALAFSMAFMFFSGINAQMNRVCAEEGTQGNIVDSGTCGDNLTWTLSADGVLSIRGNGDLYCGNFTDSRITSAIVESGVTIIGNKAFDGCSNLKSITIPDSVTIIGNRAFDGCSSLKSITIPDSVTIIDAWAFEGCSSLESITIPDSVTSIGFSAFEGCSNLTSITIPDSVKSIGHSSFKGCSSLLNITIPDGVKSIGYNEFKGCSSLKSITIPDSVTSIGDFAFEGCSSLLSVTIPDSVTSIGCKAFYGTEWLSDMREDNPLVIVNGILIEWYECSGDITIPDSVTGIGGSAFEGCSSLTSITIPAGVTSIGSSAFRGCSSLRSITIPNSVTSIGYGAFNACSNLKSIIIPDSITSIGDFAFWGCSSLRSITIPASVTRIGDEVFYECSDSLVIKGYPNSVAEIYAKEYEIEFVSLSGCSSHTWETGVVTANATCAKKGTKTYTCTLCGETKTEDIPMLKHTAVTDNAVAATCGKRGKTEGSHCSVCGIVITAQKTVEATGKHTYSSWKVTKAATALDVGKKTHKCKVCGKVQTKTIAKLKPTIKLSKTKATIKKDKTLTIKVSKLAKGDAVKSWKTSNKKIATVKNGKIKAVKKGKATITVTLKSGRKATVKVTVK